MRVVRARRLGRNVAAVALVAAGAMAAALVGAQPASAFAPPVPVAIPGAAGGAEAATGAGAAELCAGTAGGLCIAVAGYGAYKGTCYALENAAQHGGVLQGGSCAAGWNTIMGWFGFGPKGDNRATTNGLTAAPDPSVTLAAGQAGTFSWSYTNGFQVDMTCTKGSQSVTRTPLWHISGTSGTWSTALSCAASSADYWCNGSPATPCSMGSTPDGSSWSTWTMSRLSWATPGPSGGTANNPVVPVTFPGSKTGFASWATDSGVGTPWTVTQTVTCRKGSATATAGVSETFTPSPNYVPPQQTLPNCDSILPGGHIDQLVITGGRQGYPNTDVTVTLPTYNQNAVSNYPVCTTNSGDTPTCLLDLQRNGQSCFTGNVWCAGWTQYESEMKCLWGPYTVPISWCEDSYRTSWDTQPNPQTTSTTSAGAGTSTSAQPSSSAQPSGQPFPSTGTNPDPSTGASPTTTVGLPGPAPDPTDSDGANCLGSMWTWNPYNWVEVPIKCALRWAFVPSGTGIAALFDSFNGSFDASTPGQWFHAFGGMLDGLHDDTTGCRGPGITWDGFAKAHQPTTIYPFNGCDYPEKYAADASYLVCTAGIGFFGGLRCVQALAAGFHWRIHVAYYTGGH